ncbi:MAG: cytidylate kinase family protein [Candidatus Woesearchaeota archaeon]
MTIITFSGHNGSGKTAVSKEVAKQLGFSWWGMAEITRAHAEELGISILEHDRMVANNPDIDRELDKKLAELSSKEDIVVDSRAGWHFLPESIKVFLTASEAVRAQRAFSGQRSNEKYATVEDARRGLAERIEVFRSRLQKLYGINVYDEKNFDIVIDTSDMSVEEVVMKVLEEVQL